MSLEASAMKGITGFRLRAERRAQPASEGVPVKLPAAQSNPDALKRVMSKIEAMGDRFYAMSESEYGDWLDALPQDEFIEFIGVMVTLSGRPHGTYGTTR